jgi:S1-C subfamily serine protease
MIRPSAAWLLVLAFSVLAPVAVQSVTLPEMGWLGISIGEVNEELADRLASVFGPAAGTGVQVVEVLTGGPAEAARLQRGDVIVRADTQPIWDVRQLQRVIRAQPVNRSLLLTVLRGESRMTVPVVVGPMPLAARAQIAAERFGFTVRQVEESAASGAATPARIVVAFVDPSSPAAGAGLQPLDALVRVNDRPVRDLEAFARALRDVQATLALVIERRNASAPIPLTVVLPR